MYTTTYIHVQAFLVFRDPALGFIQVLPPQQIFLNFLSNYIPNGWNSVDGCIACKDGFKKLPTDRSEWPSVLLAVFIERPTPFLLEVLEGIHLLDYPKEKITLWVHNEVSCCSVIYGEPFRFTKGSYTCTQSKIHT